MAGVSRLGRSSMKVAVIGLDCATPQLVFDRFRESLPNLSRLMTQGIWGPLTSCHPPITVPAWACMMSGRDPGELGIYGFRNRRDYSYGGYVIADARAIRVDRVWDILSRAGKRIILLGVPQTYPIKPVNGVVVSDFLTPSTRDPYTFPSSLKEEVERVSCGYVLDVENFRTEDKASLLQRIYEKTRKHFTVARHLLGTRAWDFFMMVEMGVDRIHHGFWSYMDPAHPKYKPGTPFEDAIRDYYRYVDREVGQTLDLLPPETVVFVVSDHGARKMAGGICLNEWLIREGHLVLTTYPDRPTPIDKLDIDWGRTRAWGDGGYYGRLFLNVRGREPQGTIAPGEYGRVREDLIAALEGIEDPEGRNIGTRVYRPEELYREVNGVAPDLLVYFGNLGWRSVGSVGLRAIHAFENDTGPDEANHDWNGIFLMRGIPGIGGTGRIEDLRLEDVGETILRLFGLEIPGWPRRARVPL